MARNYEEKEPTAEEKLWRAVVANALEEWIHGPLSRQLEAEQFLFRGGDFHTVCCSAGLDPEYLRERLKRIRVRENAEARAAASRNAHCSFFTGFLFDSFVTSLPK